MFPRLKVLQDYISRGRIRQDGVGGTMQFVIYEGDSLNNKGYTESMLISVCLRTELGTITRSAFHAVRVPL